MHYAASLTDFFKSPKWGMNLLLGAVTCLIPVVGPIVLSGWLITIFWARGDDEDAAQMPPFDFLYFTKYLERGLWPFLVNLVAGLVISVVTVPLALLPLLTSGVMGAGALAAGPGGLEHVAAATLLLAFGAMMVFSVVLGLASTLVLVPLMLRATITQAFAAAWDAGFVWSFIRLVWLELLLCGCFMGGVSLGLSMLGMITCGIGILAVVPLMMFVWQHLLKQLYQLYLSRGGAAVPLSPQLSDLPPPCPASQPPPPPTLPATGP